MEHVLKRRTVKARLSRYFALVLAMTCVLAVALLRFSLSAVRACQSTLEAINEMDAFFSECEALEAAIEGCMLYGEAQEPGTLAALAAGLNARLAYLQEAEISDGFYRSVQDMRAALASVRAGIDAMPDAGREALSAYYETDFALARSALAGIRLEEPGLSAKLLSAGAQLQARMTRRIYQCAAATMALAAVWAVLMVRYGMQMGRLVSRPIEQLTQGVLRSGSAQAMEPIRVEDGGGWEVENLTAAFNGMMERIAQQWQRLEEKAEVEKTLHEQKMENLRIAGELKSSQMQALQRQINPHFLFNTLNMIMDTAYLEEAPETMELLRSAAAFLRYSLDSCEKQVTLGREMQALGDYVFLQEKRFGERIRFRFELDESLSGTRMPALVLQPLVENAVAHGVGSYASDARIEIRTERGADGCVLITVRDNGVGMEEQQLQALRERLMRAQDDPQGQCGIGLANVARRLHVFYGGRAALEVRSAQGRGTEVALRLPQEA